MNTGGLSFSSSTVNVHVMVAVAARSGQDPVAESVSGPESATSYLNCVCAREQW